MLTEKEAALESVHELFEELVSTATESLSVGFIKSVTFGSGGNFPGKECPEPGGLESARLATTRGALRMLRGAPATLHPPAQHAAARFARARARFGRPMPCGGARPSEQQGLARGVS